MPKEISGFTNTIKGEINRKNFGWIFASENASLDGKNINYITVYKARNLLYDADNSTYEPVYKTHLFEANRLICTSKFLELPLKDMVSSQIPVASSITKSKLSPSAIIAFTQSLRANHLLF